MSTVQNGSVVPLRFINRGSHNPSILIEGSLEVKLPTTWTDEKQSRAEAERRERLEERRSEMKSRAGQRQREEKD
jgi:hypothetical protein